MSKNSAQVGIRLQKSVEKYPGINNDEKSMTLIITYYLTVGITIGTCSLVDVGWNVFFG
jgi:hypothetical protein